MSNETLCKECGFDPAERYQGGMMKHRAGDRQLAKDYCEHESDYRHTVKPIWKDCCGVLSHYNVIRKPDDRPSWQR